MPLGTQEPVFFLGSVPFTWQDVRAHAVVTGAWAGLEQAAREGVACERLADEGDEEVDEDAIEAAAEEFRYERDLVTADEMEAWLARQGLSAEEWMGYIRRTWLLAEWEGRLGEIAASHVVDDAQVARALEVDLCCSGGRVELARRLAQDVAAAAASGLVATAGDASARDMARIRAGADAYRESVATAEAVARAVSGAPVDWIRVECQVLAFRDEHEAREAVLCVREDGVDLALLARDARREVQEVAFFLADIEPDHRAPFLSARVGEVVGPLLEGDQYAIYQVTAKVLPEPGDPDVAERARAAIVARHLEAEVNHRVHWHADVPAQ